MAASVRKFIVNQMRDNGSVFKQHEVCGTSAQDAEMNCMMMVNSRDLRNFKAYKIDTGALTMASK